MVARALPSDSETSVRALITLPAGRAVGCGSMDDYELVSARLWKGLIVCTFSMLA